MSFRLPEQAYKVRADYLGRYERTDTSGNTGFYLPATAYKFRVDYNGIQYWSDVINVLPHDETLIDLPLDLLALDLTNDPKPVRFNGEPPEYQPEQIRVASTGDGVELIPVAYYHITDHLGTQQLVTDDQGEIVWQTGSLPFGETQITNATMTNNLRFPGQYYDEETGLHYNLNIYYDPSTGRYLTPDPIGLAGGINPLGDRRRI